MEIQNTEIQRSEEALKIKANQEEEVVTNSSIFVNGLPKLVDKSCVRLYFTQFGKVEHIRIFTKRGKEGTIRGFAKIKFKEREQMLKAIEKKSHIFGDYDVEIRELQSQAELEYQLCADSKLVYVTNIDYTVKKEEFVRFILPLLGAKRVVRMIKNKKGKKQKEKELEETGIIDKFKSAVIELFDSDNRPIEYFVNLQIKLKKRELYMKAYEDKEAQEKRRELEKFKEEEDEENAEEETKQEEKEEPKEEVFEDEETRKKREQEQFEALIKFEREEYLQRKKEEEEREKEEIEKARLKEKRKAEREREEEEKKNKNKTKKKKPRMRAKLKEIEEEEDDKNSYHAQDDIYKKKVPEPKSKNKKKGEEKEEQTKNEKISILLTSLSPSYLPIPLLTPNPEPKYKVFPSKSQNGYFCYEDPEDDNLVLNFPGIVIRSQSYLEGVEKIQYLLIRSKKTEERKQLRMKKKSAPFNPITKKFEDFDEFKFGPQKAPIEEAVGIEINNNGDDLEVKENEQ